ncbi:PIN domain-containing protein [bacterium]|nr:PIN domain-containing protein [bacterium]
MKRIFLDTNIVLDLIDRQRRGHQDALVLEQTLESHRCKILCAWHSLSVIEYIGTKTFGLKETHELLRQILVSFIIPKTGTEEALQAFRYLDRDYEDALQISAAIAGAAHTIITNDRTGFTKSPIPVMTPSEFVTRHRQD